MTDPGPLYQMPPDRWGDDPFEDSPVWYQAGGRPLRNAPRPPRPRRALVYVNTTRPDGTPVVFAPGDVLPDWATT